jgi:hypothetical protein
MTDDYAFILAPDRRPTVSHSHKKHLVHLSRDERLRIEKLLDERRLPVRPRLRLQVLLLSDESPAGNAMTDEQIKLRTRLSVRTIEWIRATYCAGGLDALTTWRGRPAKPADA